MRLQETRWPLRTAPLALLLAILLAVPQPTMRARDWTTDRPAVVRLYVRDRDHLNAVAGELDIWEVHFEAGYAVAAVTPDQMAWLDELGYALQVDEEPAASGEQRIPLDPRFHTFDAQTPNPDGRYVVDVLQGIDDAYPHLTELLEIGTAWEEKRSLLVLRVSSEDPAFGPIEEKPAFFLLATTHAREVATPELALRYARYLTEGYSGAGGYGIDPDVTWLVDHHAAYVLVMQNPDGHAVNADDTRANHRKNTNNTSCAAGTFGVDLNRNTSFMWGCCGGASDHPCHDTYRGTGPASEPETEALETLLTSVMGDQNGPNGDDELPQAAPADTSGVLITLHAYGDMTLWPWGFSGYGRAPNHAQLETIGRKLALHTGYTTFDVGYDVDGAVDDWAYGKLGIASFTFEVGATSGPCGGFFPAYECLDGPPGYGRSFWAENRPALLYAHRIARAPYTTSYGPDTVNVVLTPATADPGTSVGLSALAQDRRLDSDMEQPITGAEYFIDRPGADGTGTPLAPADGTWGDWSEEVTATLDTSYLAPGRHYVLVRGRNASGDWGPFSAAFLSVAPAEYALHVSVMGAGHVTAEPERQTYARGEVVTLTAAAHTGWTFGEWSGDVVTTTNPVALSMDGDKVVTAAFVLTVGERLYLPMVVAEE